MKTTKELNIKDWSEYFFKEMVNILDIEPEYFMVNDFKGCKNGSIIFNLYYCSENCVPHIVFNNIECIFRKRGVYSYLIFWETDKNKNMINNYVRIIDQLKEESLPWIDELEEDEIFTVGKDLDLELMIIKINITVCVISLSSVVKKRYVYYPQFRLQKCFYECKN